MLRKRMALCLGVVLGFGSICNAAMYLTVDGVVEPNGLVVLDVNETAVIGIRGDGNTPLDCFFLGLEAGSSGAIEICDANILYSGNMSSIEMVDCPEASELFGVNNPFMAAELIDFAMPPDGPAPLSGQLVDNIVVTGPGTLLLFDGGGNRMDISEPNDFMGESLPDEITAEISESSSGVSSRAAAVTRTTRLVYCPPEPNVPFDSNSMEDFGPGGFGDIESLRMMSGEDGGGEMMLDERPEVEVTSDITTNQIWTADNIYEIDRRTINIRALLVIEPGTEIHFLDGEHYSTQLRVNSGGTLISCGTPDNMIYYTSGHSEYDLYDCAIVIEETASPATRIEYSKVELAEKGIVVNNNRLDNPIRNNAIYDNVYGIVEYGPKLTDIVNNLVSGIHGNGIEVHLASQGGVADANSHILIESNTCACNYYSGYYYDDGDGITIYGSAEPEDAGEVILADNIVAQSHWYGLCFTGEGPNGGYVRAGIYNTGYYDNGHEKSPWDPNRDWEGGNKWPDDVNLPQENPVETDEMPFVFDSNGYMRCSLVPDCPFIDAGSQYIEDTMLVSRTTDFNAVPDSNIVDIGFHHSDYGLWWHYVNAGEGVALGDINQDAATDLLDLELLVSDWLNPSPDDANDINDDGIVNLKDYAILAQTWYKIQGHPNIRPVVSGNPANLSGSVDVNVMNFGPWAWRAFVLMDGQFIREIIGFNEPNAGVLGLDSREYNNGQHNLKVVTVDYSGLVTVSPVLDVNFSNDLYCVSGAESFEEGKDYQISAMFSDSNDLRVKLVDWDGTDIYTSSATTGYVNATIPTSAFTNQIYDLKIEKQAAEWEGLWENSIGLAYKSGDTTPYDFAIFLPETTGRPAYPGDHRKLTVMTIIHSCNLKSKRLKILSKGECTWDNFASLLQQPTVRYIYLATHGNLRYRVGNWWETVDKINFDLTGSRVLADYSGPPLPPASSTVHYLNRLNLGEKMRIVHVDACFQVPIGNDDMAMAWLGVYDPLWQPVGRVMIGWKGWIPFFIDNFDLFSANIWFSMAFRGTNFHDAQIWALAQDHSWIWHDWIADTFGYKGDNGNTTSFP